MDIKQIVDKCGKSKADIAREMETSPSYITQLVSGKPEPTLRKLQQLADIIGCKRWQLFADEMEIADVIEYFKDDMQAEIDRRIAEAVEAKEKKMTEQAEAKSKEYEQRISELQHQLDTREPSRQGALICPNCGRPFVIKVIATASTE